jgi:uncharacterized membrane protein
MHSSSIVPSLVLAALCSAAPFAHAAQRTWTVCNRTPEPVRVAVAYGAPGGGYESRGWWDLPACGGCKVVLSRDVPVTGAFLRGESRSGAVFADDTLMCTSVDSPFAIGRADLERNCSGRAGEFKTFSMHHLSKARHTTNLTGKGPNGRVCID